MSKAFTLAIDQGTTSTRVGIFDDNLSVVSQAQKSITSSFPENGWVEQDPEDIWSSVLYCYQQSLQNAKLRPSDLSALGITNQRETVIIWDRQTGAAIYPAIVWQDRRTQAFCNTYQQNLAEACERIQVKTGLCMDPYFSATKIRWILDHVSGAQQRAENGELAFGTIDCFILWRLTHGHSHTTDVTNASRTLLYNINTHQWDEELLSLFNIPPAMLPDIQNCGYAYGLSGNTLLGHEIPISGIAGDQHASLVGQNCLSTGTAKLTLGTGGFLMVNTGKQLIHSQHQMLSTIGYQLDGKVSYAMEGSIFMAGATMDWLKSGLGLIDNIADSHQIAQSTRVDHGVYIVPAFTGLGAPHWLPDARGAIMGLTRDTNASHIISAGLQAIAYQVYDLFQCLNNDNINVKKLHVDGGMAKNPFAMQFLSDIIQIPVITSDNSESTIRGVAIIAAHHAGLIETLTPVKNIGSRTYAPTMKKQRRDILLAGWQKAINAVISNR